MNDEDYNLAHWHQYEQELLQQIEEMRKAWEEIDEQTRRTNVVYLEYIRRAL